MNKKVWFITGISSGLGKALAEEVMQNGDFVIGTFRKQHQVDNFNNIYESQGFAYVLDVTNFQQIDITINKIKEKFNSIDVLVNNAGVGFVGGIEETSLQELRTVFEANFFSTFYITQKILPLMRSQRCGHIIQISSHAGIKAFAGFGIYNASKFALEGFSEALAQEIQPLGLQLTIVQPGPFRTEFASKKLNESAQVIDAYSETAGIFRDKLKSVDGKQEGNPKQAATIIYNITKTKPDFLRLPLGKVPFTTIQMKLDSVSSDLNKTKELGESAVF